jgi:hypothetical protein
VDWQIISVSLAVLAAGAFVLRRTYRTWFGSKAGCSGCACPGAEQRQPAPPALIPTEQLTARLRSPARS